MSLTNKGFDARRFPDIRAEMFEEMANNLAIELDTSPDQVLSIITNIFASSVADIEELAQAVADNFNIDKAEGKYLDAKSAIETYRESYTVDTNKVVIGNSSVDIVGYLSDLTEEISKITVGGTPIDNKAAFESLKGLIDTLK